VNALWIKKITIDTGEKNNNREVINEDNNSDPQTHDNGKKITRLNNSTIKNMYDPNQWKHIDTKFKRLITIKISY